MAYVTAPELCTACAASLSRHVFEVVWLNNTTAAGALA